MVKEGSLKLLNSTQKDIPLNSNNGHYIQLYIQIKTKFWASIVKLTEADS